MQFFSHLKNKKKSISKTNIIEDFILMFAILYFLSFFLSFVCLIRCFHSTIHILIIFLGFGFFFVIFLVVLCFFLWCVLGFVFFFVGGSDGFLCAIVFSSLLIGISHINLFKIIWLCVCNSLFVFVLYQNTKCKNIIYLFLFGDLVVHIFCCRNIFLFLIFFLFTSSVLHRTSTIDFFSFFLWLYMVFGINNFHLKSFS